MDMVGFNSPRNEMEALNYDIEFELEVLLL